jgi:hypothetical protein
MAGGVSCTWFGCCDSSGAIKVALMLWLYGMMMMMFSITAVLQTLSVQWYCSTAARMMCYGIT